MNLKKLKKLLEKSGVITCLTENEKQKLRQQNYLVREIETPCGSSGNQSVEKIQ